MGRVEVLEMRPGKVHNKNPNYCRMVYNTDFPWEANSKSGAISGSLRLKGKGQHRSAVLPLYVDVAGYRDNVFYRQMSFSKGHHTAIVDMASIIIPGGEIRVDRLRKISETSLYLGHFALPHQDGHKPTLSKKTIDGANSLVLKIPGRQLVMTNYLGWDKLDSRENKDLHPEAEYSTLLYSEKHDLKRRYGPVEILVSILLHKTDDSSWSDDELQPIQEIKELVKGVPMHLGGLKVLLKNGKEYQVEFKGIDGASSRH